MTMKILTLEWMTKIKFKKLLFVNTSYGVFFLSCYYMFKIVIFFIIVLIIALACYDVSPKRKHRYKLVIINFKNKQTMAQAKIQVSQNLAAILGLTDTVTNQPVQATFTDVVWSSDNTDVFTTEANEVDANEQDITGVSAGTANLNVSATASYTDSNGDAQAQSLTSSIPVTVNNAADGVTLNVTFGAATPVATSLS